MSRPEISWTWGTEGEIVWAELEVLSDMDPESVIIKYSETGEDFLEKGVYKRDWRWTVPGPYFDFFILNIIIFYIFYTINRGFSVQKIF